MSDRTVAQKGHIKPGTSIAVLNAVPGVVESLGLPAGAGFVEPAEAGLVLLFVRTRQDLDTLMPPAAAGLRAGPSLWVFYRKGSKGAGLDLNRDDIWALADRLGMRPLGLVSVDETWSAFRLRPA
jgi:hypothetical protein